MILRLFLPWCSCAGDALETCAGDDPPRRKLQTTNKATLQGQLFTQDFLRFGIRETPPYQALSDEAFAAFESRLRRIFSDLSASTTLNEAQTEKQVIEPVLAELGWGQDFLPQVNLSGKRREDVPDILLFADA